MTDVKSSPSGHRPSTREQRGIQIAREHADEVWPCGEELRYWRVPGSDGETIYLVDVARESCSCEDHTRTRKPCKHLFAVLTVRAKRSSCHCFGKPGLGWHYIRVEEDGQEHDEAVRCRRCTR